MLPPGALCIIQCLNYRPRVVVQRDNANNIYLLGKTIESITDVQWGRENLDLRVQHSSGKWSCELSWTYSIWFRSNEPDTTKALHYMNFRHRELIKKKQFSQSCLRVSDTSSWYELAICELSKIYIKRFRGYEEDTNFQHYTTWILGKWG